MTGKKNADQRAAMMKKRRPSDNQTASLGFIYLLFCDFDMVAYIVLFKLYKSEAVTLMQTTL